ncbi:MAG: phospholipase D-like domain-containing protein [Endomicrobia bacterium]|nr:phospholipase D-like domain-containing protein [Endomicrobiia bacterium]
MIVFIVLFLSSLTLSFAQINVYFTDPYNTLSSLSLLSTNKKPIDFALKEFIESTTAGTTVYICIYEINNSTISMAIDKVVTSGVKVYAIFDADVSTGIFKSNFSWKKLAGTSKNPFMHNKFVVVKSSKVWCGSYNFTLSASYEQDNFALEIFSSELADIYEKAFLHMWDGRGKVEDFNNKQIYLNDGTKITVYFNPYAQNPELKDILIDNWYDKTEQKVRIKSLYFAVAWFNNEIIVEYLKLLNAQNVEVFGIVDDDTMNLSVIQSLQTEGINIYFDSRKTSYGKGLMHHKFCVVNPYSDNPKVICGSSNWTKPGLTSSDGQANYENLLVIESRWLAEVFHKEFLRLYKKILLQQKNISEDELLKDVLFYPNPVKEKLNVKFKPSMSVKEIKFVFVSLYGLKLYEQNLDFVLGVENKVEINLPSDISDGLYYGILKVKSLEYTKEYVKKVIVKKF